MHILDLITCNMESLRNGTKGASWHWGASWQDDTQLPVIAVALLSSHSSTALSDWRRAMISLLLKP